jgi:carboxypeptidase Taq
MDVRAVYEEMVRRSREITLLGSCSSLLGWDEQTFMPPGGADHRSRQVALLAGMTHAKATDARIGELLETLESEHANLDGPEAANVREWRRAYDRLVKLPRDLVEEIARETSIGQQVWVEARKRRDFRHFRPALVTIVGLKRREAECLGIGDEPYDALLDAYEPGARGRELDSMFDGLRSALVPLIGLILDSGKRPDATILDRDYPVDRQRHFGELMAAKIGFDFTRGRLDTAAHPFCSGIGPGDTRLTTRYDPRDFTESFFGILHETGHGLYDQGLDPAHEGTPMGEAVSLGIHESQSRLWENAIGRSLAFWDYAFPLAQGFFPGSLSDVSPDALRLAINEVRPSLIRTQADEVTYNLHILIRFRLERTLIAGDLPVDEVPTAWAEAYRSDLGVSPAHDGEGCLQDIHWSAGLFGYFPTYTLGNIYAAQLEDAARRDLGDVDGAIGRGDFHDLLGWLRDRVHRHGQRFRPTDLIARATGQTPSNSPLIRYLNEKYCAVYG